MKNTTPEQIDLKNNDDVFQATLLSCPFCNAAPQFSFAELVCTYYIECSNPTCQCRGPIFFAGKDRFNKDYIRELKKKVCKAWNDRITFRGDLTALIHITPNSPTDKAMKAQIKAQEKQSRRERRVH